MKESENCWACLRSRTSQEVRELKSEKDSARPMTGRRTSQEVRELKYKTVMHKGEAAMSHLARGA